jgi:hypothetical protein
MKNIYILVIALLSSPVLHVGAQDLEALELFETAMKPGAQLTYDVTANGKQYKLIATLKTVGDVFAFTWKTTDPDNKSGSVSVGAKAVAESRIFSHIFSGGDIKLDKETSLRVSDRVMTDVSIDAQTPVKLNGASDTVAVMKSTIDNFSVNINGAATFVSGFEIRSADLISTVEFIESTKFPLIVKLNMGWTMVLTDIKN